MVDRLEMLLQSKTWTELTSEERSFVSEHIESEEEYMSLRKVNAMLEKPEVFTISAKASTWSAIRSRFRERHRPLVWERAVQFRVQGLAAAILFAVAFAIGWYSGNHNKPAIAGSMPRPTVKIDTVYIPSSPDTVYLNRVVYRDRATTPASLPVFTVVKNSQTNTEGVSMKEKEELEKLLVSGSE
jgi:hypothetical protein